MKLTITFDTDDAACEENLHHEVERILTHVSERVLTAIERCQHDAEGQGPLYDTNGNRIGTWSLK